MSSDVKEKASTKRRATSSAPEKKPSVTKKKVTRKKAPARKAAPKNTLAKREDVFRKIQEQAYFLAEKNGFAGDPSQYWLAAEKAVTNKK